MQPHAILHKLIKSLVVNAIDETHLFMRMCETIRNDSRYSKLSVLCEDEIFENISDCVAANDILCVAYTLPGESRPKRMYFPIGTDVSIAAPAEKIVEFSRC